MENEAILECLEQKRALFARYEACTSEMCSCETDVLSNYIIERAGLATEIDKLNREVDDFCEAAADPELARDAVQNRGNYGDLPADLRPVYDKAAQIMTLVDHIFHMESQIQERMQTEREELRTKIKKGSGTAKVYNYLKGMQQSSQNNNIGSKKV